MNGMRCRYFIYNVNSYKNWHYKERKKNQRNFSYLLILQYTKLFINSALNLCRTKCYTTHKLVMTESSFQADESINFAPLSGCANVLSTQAQSIPHCFSGTCWTEYLVSLTLEDGSGLKRALSSMSKSIYPIKMRIKITFYSSIIARIQTYWSNIQVLFIIRFFGLHRFCYPRPTI